MLCGICLLEEDERLAGYLPDTNEPGYCGRTKNQSKTMKNVAKVARNVQTQMVKHVAKGLQDS